MTATNPTVDDVLRDLDAPAGCCDQIVVRERASMRAKRRHERRVMSRSRIERELKAEARKKGYGVASFWGSLLGLLIPVAMQAIQILVQRILERLQSVKDELDQQG